MSVARLAASLLMAVAIGGLGVHCLAPRLRTLAKLSLGCGLGLGATSGLYFLALVAGVPFAAVAALELVALAAL
ncbi:MAG: hypothetical protein ACRD96_28510, partial [Bryobacteraceae bacterium]